MRSLRPIVLLSAACGFSATGFASGYNLIDLMAGDPAGYVSINQFGDVASSTLIYHGGVVTRMGTISDPPITGNGINASRQVTGWMGNGVNLHAFMYDTSIHDLGLLGGVESEGIDINDAGVIAATATYMPNNVSVQHSFRVTNGSAQNLNTLFGGTFNSVGAEAINNAGVIVGHSSDSGNDHSIPVRWVGTTPEALGFDTGYTDGRAPDIDSSGRILVVETGSGKNAKTYVWNNGVRTDIGSLGGSAGGSAMNNLGQVIGSGTNASGSFTSFLYTPGQGMIDLNALVLPGSAYSSFQPFDINDAGQIAGIARNSSTFEYRTVLLTPVPEPLTCTGFGIGLAVLARKRRPRK